MPSSLGRCDPSGVETIIQPGPRPLASKKGANPGGPNPVVRSVLGTGSNR